MKISLLTKIRDYFYHNIKGNEYHTSFDTDSGDCSCRIIYRIDKKGVRHIEEIKYY